MQTPDLNTNAGLLEAARHDLGILVQMPAPPPPLIDVTEAIEKAHRVVWTIDPSADGESFDVVSDEFTATEVGALVDKLYSSGQEAVSAAGLLSDTDVSDSVKALGMTLVVIAGLFVMAYID
jgi:hypothetical protein